MSRRSLAWSAAGLLAGSLVLPWLVHPVGATQDCEGDTAAAPCLEADTPRERLLPIPRSVWWYGPDATALPAVEARLDEILDLVTAVNRRSLLDAEIRIHVIPRNRNVTDLAPWFHLRGLRIPDASAGDAYPEVRTYDEVRGLGPAVCGSGPLDVAIAEEQMVHVTDAAYPSPYPEALGRNLVHEVGHAIACGLTQPQQASLRQSYAAARARFPRDIVGDYPAYTVSNEREYFAEGTAAWFDSGETGTYRRAWLAEHDPLLYDLLAEVFTPPEPAARCDGQRATVVVQEGEDAVVGTPGPDVIVGSTGPDVVNGGGGADVICGGGGDDVVYGGFGADRLFGEAGNDVLAGGVDDDSIVDTEGRNRLIGGDGNNSCEHGADDEVSGCRVAQDSAPARPSAHNGWAYGD